MLIWYLFVLVLLALDLAYGQTTTPEVDADESVPPIILINSLFGSRMYVEGHDIEFPPELSYCDRDVPFRQSWVSGHLLLFPECELFMLSLRYNETTNTFENQKNVKVTVLDGAHDFGAVEPMTCLLSKDFPEFASFSCEVSTFFRYNESYYGPLIEFLKINGYEVGKTLFGAPYDWRYDPASPHMDEYYRNLTNLVEHAVNTTGKPAFLFAHSLGVLQLNHFVNKWTSEEWQNRYLNSTIYVGGPLGGAVPTMFNIVIGEGKSITIWHWKWPIIKPSVIRDFLSTLPSIGACLPTTEAFSEDMILAQFENSSFTTKEMSGFLAHRNNSQLISVYENHMVSPQNVTPIHCFYGIGIETPISYSYPYPRHRTMEPPILEPRFGDGDERVNIESLRVCQKWKDAGEKVSSINEISGTDHQGILMDNRFYDFIYYLIFKPLGSTEVRAKIWQHVLKESGRKCLSMIPVNKCGDGFKAQRTRKATVPYTCPTEARLRSLHETFGDKPVSLEQEVRSFTREVELPLTCVLK